MGRFSRGTGAYLFAIDSGSGRLTIAQPGALDFANTTQYSLTVMVGDGKLPSLDAEVIISIPAKVNVCHKERRTLSISKVDVPDHLGHGDAIGQCTD